MWVLGTRRRPALRIRRRRIEFCVRPDADLPEADRILAFKNVLEANERHFLARANPLL